MAKKQKNRQDRKHKDKYNNERIVKIIERQTDRQTGVLHRGTDRLLSRKENLYGQAG